MNARLSLGRIAHTRHAPLGHTFTYPVVFGIFDLEELPGLDAPWPLFGYNRKALLTLNDRDYLGDAPGSVIEKWRRLLGDRPVAAEVVRTRLITVPRLLGFGYNPVNFYLGYDSREALICAVAEINNTYGETHLYVLDEPLPGSTDATTEFRARKEFFVSPFFDLRGEYRFRFSRSTEQIDIRADLHREGRPALSTRLWGGALPLTRTRIASVLLRSPLSAILTMHRIAWQAWKLKRKGLPALLKPEPSSPMTIRRGPRKSHARKS